MRLGVLISSVPPGTENADALRQELRLVPEVFDHLEVDDDVDGCRLRDGRVARLPRSMVTRG